MFDCENTYLAQTNDQKQEQYLTHFTKTTPKYLDDPFRYMCLYRSQFEYLVFIQIL